MVWCAHCQDDCHVIRDPDEGFTCCAECGKVIDHDIYADEPTFTKDSSGQSRLSGAFVRSCESSYSVSHERTLQKGKDEIWSIVNRLEIGGGESTVNAAHKLYTIAVEKKFTRGRRTSHVAAACIYINCRCTAQPYLLIDFSNHLLISVYVLGAVFFQLCEKLSLEEHPIVLKTTDPSLFIFRFTKRLLGKKHDEVISTALHILNSMQRDWMQTGRKPSGLYGAAIYISALSHGLDYSKSDIISVVHICEATLTKRLVEFEDTESGGLTIEQFLTRSTVPSPSPRPGEVLCAHKDQGMPHFAHGLCKTCFDELFKLSGGLEGGAEPPAFQRAERQRIERAQEHERMNELSVEEMEAGFPKIDSDSTRCKPPASKEQESPGNQVADTSACDGQHELENSAEKDPESLSDIADSEVDVYIHNDEEARYKQIIWEEMNKEYLQEQAAKKASFANGEAEMKSTKKRKQRTAEEAKNSTPADTPLEATRQMLKKKTFSSRVNYEALEGLYTMDNGKVKNQETGGGDLGGGDAAGKFEEGDLEKGDATDKFEEDDFEEIDYDENGGYEDENYTYDALDFEEA